YDTWVKLIILGIIDFDIILGMGWLSPYHVILDCYAKNMTLAMPGVSRVECTGASGSYPSKELTYVFPTDLLGEPPDRDIDFSINLKSVTKPIYVPSYCMAPTELKGIE
ncbi:hypothetical protein MTR67_038772, partial [Solanum verrucosum]